MIEAHIFVCYGALSFDAAARIISGALAESERTYVLPMFSAELSRLPQRTVILRPDVELHELTEWTKPMAIARWFRQVLDRLDQDGIERIVAYIPHPFELPANHLAYSDPRVTRLELLPDGFLNYARTHPPEGIRKIRYLARVLLRWLAAKIVGLRYRRLPAGHLTQYEVLHYHRTWSTSFEGLLSLCGEPALLPAPREPIAGLDAGRVVLVLDQELLPLVNPRLEERLRNRLRDFVSTLDADRVLYKAHPRGRHRPDWLIGAGRRVCDVTGPELAEQLIVEAGATDLVGFYSTPLLLSGAAVARRMSVLPDPATSGVKKVQYLRDLRTALVAAGVEMVALDSRSDDGAS
jgi:hypothetical protein